MSHRKRYVDEDTYRSDHGKRVHPASPSPDPKRPSFPSYLDAPDLTPKVRRLCEIIATIPSHRVETPLEDACVRITPEDVEEVLKLSYSYPGTAVKFFRWAGAQLNHRHSPYAWNLVVDLLGKNLLFDAMWDAVKSMHAERLLSLATFASIFGSFAAAARPDEAFAAFNSMDSRHGIPRDSAALNTLLSALCREGLTSAAREFLTRVCHVIPPDADTYAILLEGCENERDVHGAHLAFADMVSRFGWDPANVPAYDSFLSTIVRRLDGISETLKLLDLLEVKRCYPGMKFFRNALEVFAKEGDARGASAVWAALVGKNGCYPDTPMYNSMITLQCFVNQFDEAQQFMDEMVRYGAFPDSQTYNAMLQFLLKERKLREAAAIFNEMVKNECCPSSTICELAIKVFLDTGDWEMGVKAWRCMVENDLHPLEENGNMIVLKLRDLDRTPEACKLAEDMIERGIKLNSSTLTKLKASLVKAHKGNLYDDILKKWKGH